MVWRAGQCGQFLDSVTGRRDYALWHLAAYWGLRRGELLGLTWADVDLGTRQVHVAASVEWGDAWADSGHVFTREDGTPLRPGWVSERFRALSARAGLPPARFHDLRHGAATMLRAAGVDIKTISAVLGHARTDFTDDVYVTVAEEMSSAAASAIAAFVPRRASNVPAGGPDDH